LSTRRAHIAPPAPPAGAGRAAEDRFLWRSFRHHSRTFSLAARLLPRTERLPIATLYLYCRSIDTLADERVTQVGAAAALRELAEARENLLRSLDARPPADLLWARLAEVHDAYGLPARPLLELLDGAEWDLRNRPIRSETDLVTYSELVAGSVGEMMLPFLVPAQNRSSELVRAARALGNAMQITNILRDVGEDIRRLGRVYLPFDLLEEHGVPHEALRRAAAGGDTPAGYPRLMEAVMGIAEGFYARAEPGIRALPVRSRVGIAAAARMYREILNEVRASGYDNLRQRNIVDLPRKLRLVAQDDYGRRKSRLLQSPPLQVA
jgi:15-cis-phytoene synthase